MALVSQETSLAFRLSWVTTQLFGDDVRSATLEVNERLQGTLEPDLLFAETNRRLAARLRTSSDLFVRELFKATDDPQRLAEAMERLVRHTAYEVGGKLRSQQIDCFRPRTYDAKAVGPAASGFGCEQRFIDPTSSDQTIARPFVSPAPDPVVGPWRAWYRAG